MDLKIISWNVNGLQGILKKDKYGKKYNKIIDNNTLANMIKIENPDIVCLQEIKCSNKFNYTLFFDFKYHYSNCCECKKGYSGTLILSKIKPDKIILNFGSELEDNGLDKEGRMITLIFPTFILVNVYVPNSGSYRLGWR